MEEMNEKKHSLSIYDRREAVIDGVNKLESFDKSQFNISTNMGNLIIKGDNLVLGNMDMEKGTLSINGHIDGLYYTSSSGTDSKKEGFFKKLFK